MILCAKETTWESFPTLSPPSHHPSPPLRQDEKDELRRSARAAGVAHLVVPGSTLGDSRDALALAAEPSFLHAPLTSTVSLPLAVLFALATVVATVVVQRSFILPA